MINKSKKKKNPIFQLIQTKSKKLEIQTRARNGKERHFQYPANWKQAWRLSAAGSPGDMFVVCTILVHKYNGED